MALEVLLKDCNTYPAYVACSLPLGTVPIPVQYLRLLFVPGRLHRQTKSFQDLHLLSPWVVHELGWKLLFVMDQLDHKMDSHHGTALAFETLHLHCNAICQTGAPLQNHTLAIILAIV